MPFSSKTVEEKPYNMCLDCSYIGKNCDGPNFLAMSTERWCEWCRLRKEYLGWTNAFVAEQAGISKVSVDRVMSGNVKDLRISTMQAVTKVLVNGTWGQYPCAISEISGTETVYVDNPDLVAKAEKAEKECDRLRTALDSITSEHKAEIATAHAETEIRLDYLKEQIRFKEDQMKAKDKLLDERRDFLARKDKVIKQLSVMLILAVAIIIFALVIDRLNSDIGFLWIDKMSALIGKDVTAAEAAWKWRL